MTSTLNTYDWYIEKDLSDFSGKWVVIIDNKVVDSGSKVGILLSKAKKAYPGKKPFVAKIEDMLSIL